MSWLTNVMAGNSRIKGELIELAERSKDVSLPAKDRLNAMFELALAVEAGEELQTLLDSSLEELENTEPKYVWKNGAKVRVK